VAHLQVPIGCVGVAVYPGDVLIGDRDGLLVIPRALATEIGEQDYEQEQIEAVVSKKIHAGEPLWGKFPARRGAQGQVQGWLAAGEQR
jgi:regulator of RNase E activity RraA